MQRGKNTREYVAIDEVVDLLVEFSTLAIYEECSKELLDAAEYFKKRARSIVTGKEEISSKWIICGKLEGKTVMKCSHCGQGITSMFAPVYRFCPTCGSYMSEDKE